MKSVNILLNDINLLMIQLIKENELKMKEMVKENL